ncbi:MAG: tetratricopeptide repeat protein [Candidatus Lokiarchaeota archaeon]|nr:tetratricopeptide repeat protein [Candidatus Lokiarchaeota archaeon]
MSNNQYIEIDHFIAHGKYVEALDIISSIKKERELSDKEILLKKFIMIYIYLDKGEFQKGKDAAEALIQESQNKNNLLFEIDAIIGKIENIINLELFEESFKLIQKAEKLCKKIKDLSIEELKRRESYLEYLKGRIYQEEDEIIKALNSFKQSLAIRKSINDEIGMIFSLISIGSLTIGIGNFKEGEIYINDSLKIAKKLDIESGIIWNLINLGWIKFHMRELNEVFSIAKECLSICEPKDYMRPISFCYDLIGSCHMVKGNLTKALFFFLKSLYIRIKMRNNNLITVSYYCIGNVYSRKGELKRCLSYYNKGLKTLGLNKRKMSKPAYLSVVGKIYGELGDFEKAKKYLLEALDLLKDNKIILYHHLNFTSSLTTTLHYLIILCVNNNDLDNANKYLEELDKISDKYLKIKQIKQIYRLDKAIILKSSNRLMDKMEAWTIFKGIIDDLEINDYELTIEAMTHLCELLIYELELTGDNEILYEIESLSDKLLEIAKKQYLHDVLAETYFFKAKISLLNLDINNARYLLTKAQNLANKFELVQLAKKISNEHDSLLTHLDEWEEKIKKKTPLLKRVENMKHEFLFSKTVRTQIEELPNESDTPIYFVILSSYNGRCIYSKAFEDISVNDGNLIASFISAINIFGKEAFSSSGTIDRIRHGEYLIVLQSKEDYIFGYVFKGQSYSAISKLDTFIENLAQITNNFGTLDSYIRSHREISLETRSSIEQLLNKILTYENN